VSLLSLLYSFIYPRKKQKTKNKNPVKREESLRIEIDEEKDKHDRAREINVVVSELLAVKLARENGREDKEKRSEH
jgi:post-segregation antitoxin (ccd killing protein)